MHTKDVKIVLFHVLELNIYTKNAHILSTPW